MLHAEYVDIGEDLKESYSRSRYLHRSIGKISSGVGVSQAGRTDSPASPQAAKKREMKKKSEEIAKASPPKYATPQKHQGKTTLANRLQEFNHRLLRTKAGKSIAQLPGVANSPAIDRVEKFLLQSSTMSSFWGSRNLSWDSASQRKLPHVSLISGKVHQPLRLPSFSEYCDKHKIDVLKAPAGEKAIRQASKVIERMQKLKKHINGLSVLLHESPGIRWDKDTKVLYRLDKHPEQKASIIKAYASKMTGRKSVNNDRKGLSLLENSMHNSAEAHRSGLDAARAIKKCADGFTASQVEQSQQLIDILDRYEIERPFLVQRKLKCFAGEKQSLRDIGHAMQRFSEYRRETDEARKARIRKAQEQTRLYEKMLEFLKQQAQEPSEGQLACLEIVKGLLEEGWVLDRAVLEKVRDTLGGTLSEEVKKLLEVIEEEIEQ